MVIIIFIFAYSSVLGNYAYAEVNDDFFTRNESLNVSFEMHCCFVSGIGYCDEFEGSLSLADLFSGGMVALNIFAVFALGKWALGALKRL